MDILAIGGIVLAVIGIGLTIYFGITHVSKQTNKTNIKKSYNNKAGKNSNVNVKIDNSFNSDQKIGGEE